MPFVGRLILALAVVSLGLGVVYVGISGIGTVVGAVGSTVGGFVDGVTATASPAPSFAEISDAPSVDAPEEPYTRAATTDLASRSRTTSSTKAESKLRIYLALKDQEPAPIDEVPIAGPVTIVPVTLTKGMNDFTVTIVGPGGESDPSPVVRFIQDQVPPKITVSSPKSGAIVNGKAVTIKGKTQGRTTLIARNATNGASITSDALADGTFSLTLAIAPGREPHHDRRHRPGGQCQRDRLRRQARDRQADGLAGLVRVSDPARRTALWPPADRQCERSGWPAAGRSQRDLHPVHPGIPTITAEGTTSANGIATFRTTIPKGADLGQGSATVLVSSDEFGSTQDFTVITIAR